MASDSSSGERQNLQGNVACALGAIAAGCRFYAGYPITPSSEIAEQMAARLPKVDGVFVQMEDEIASIGAILGASVGGVKSMTATSGPGFSLMQEGLGYASQAEIPCVIIDVMRGGPSTGMPTRPSQGDVMQARWGSHGDRPVIALAPASVGEVFEQMLRAFNLSETLRTPVVVLIDEAIAHLSETIDLSSSMPTPLASRKVATGDVAGFLPYAATDDGVPAMQCPGDGYRSHMTGLTHGEDGFPTQDPATVERVMRQLLGKLDRNMEQIECFETLECDDVDVLVVAYGITARAARRAVVSARERGLRAGLLRPITLWPFPERRFRELASSANTVLIPEMNAGQLCVELERLCPHPGPVVRLNRIDGECISPRQILEQIEKLHAHD
ncbi:MAG: 2-oxoacid:acceptor oxidoreductase subunit alpha [bacterium]|nr:2-oxoacid:acceptor oxidoreductase subunit alpha [bacterium]